MDAAEAARILVQKVRPWVQQFTEWRVAIDTLAGLVEDQTPGAFDGRRRERPEQTDRITTREQVQAAVADLGTRVDPGLVWYFREQAWAWVPEPKVVPPKVGDEVPDYTDAIKLPAGTTIESRGHVRGLRIDHPDRLMQIVWSTNIEDGGRWPASIVALP